MTRGQGGEIDFASHIGEIARRLCGNPNQRLSKNGELRFGTNGSLSVKIDGDCAGTFYDHEKDSGGGALDLIGRKLGLSRSDAAEWVKMEIIGEAPRAAAPSAADKRRIVETYGYFDGETLLHETVRYEPKAFSQRRPDGKGGWIWSLNGIEPILYRRDELRASTGLVFICEGEKDCDNLAALGFTATTNPMGAGKWRTSYDAELRGRDVVVLADNDEAGRKHCREIINGVSAVASSIRRLELPGLAPKGDVSDWLASGGTAAELLRLVESTDPIARLAEPDDPQTSPLGEWDAGDDIDPIPPREWLLGNSFCRRFLSSVVAGGGVGKSSFRIAQLLACATGRNLTGEYVFQRSRVLLVSLEDDKEELRRRVRAAMLHHGVSADEVKGWLFLAAAGSLGMKVAVTRNGETARGELADILSATIRERQIDILSIDPFVKAHAVEENANDAIDFVANTLATLAIENNCAVDAPHHVRKGETEAGDADAGRGAGAFKDAARLVYTLKQMSKDEAKGFGIPEDERRRLIRVDSAKVNIAPASEAKWFLLVGVQLGNGTEAYPKGDEVQTVEPWTPPDLWEHISTTTANDILDEIDAGLPGGGLYSDHNRAGNRSAHLIVKKHAPTLTDEQARKVIKTWVENGLLQLADYHDKEARKDRKGLRANPAKRPG